MRELLLVPGWGFGSAAWSPLIPLLAGHGRIRQTHLTGYGEAIDIDTLIPATVICGWSLGAQVAMKLAAAHPERVSRLILIGASPRFVRCSDWPAGLAADVLDDFAAAVAANPARALKRFAALVNQGDDDARTATRTLLALTGTPPAAEVLADGLRALRDDDLRAMVSGIKQPTLLIHGDNDALMPVAAAQWLAAHLADAELRILPGRGHAPFLSATTACAESIREFLVG
jgi:pimeloyl-[acyl-carrier protein] methyl ester esterase